MNKNTIVAFAAAASAFAQASLAFAQEMAGETSTPQPEKSAPEATEEPKPSGRGRKAAAPVEKEEPVGKTLADMQALIKPVIEAGNGVAVKAAISKYTDGKLADMDAKHYPAFEKDIEALSM